MEPQPPCPVRTSRSRPSKTPLSPSTGTRAKVQSCLVPSIADAVPKVCCQIRSWTTVIPSPNTRPAQERRGEPCRRRYPFRAAATAPTGRALIEDLPVDFEPSCMPAVVRDLGEQGGPQPRYAALSSVAPGSA